MKITKQINIENMYINIQIKPAHRKFQPTVHILQAINFLWENIILTMVNII